MSSTPLGAGERGATANLRHDSDPGDSEHDSASRWPIRGALARGTLTAVALFAVVSAAAGGGVVGYRMGMDAESASLSGPAHGEAAAYAASAPNGAVEPAVKEVVSSYETRLTAVIAEQRQLRGDLERARARHEEARRELGQTERAFAETSRDLDAASRRLAALRAQARRDDVHDLGEAEALAEAQSEVQELRLELAAAQGAKEDLAQTLGTLATTMEKVIAERDDAAARAEALDRHIAALSEKQDRMLDRLENAARVSLSGMRGIFERAGVDVERVLGETREEYSGAGGPFEALADEVGARSDSTGMRVAALMTDLEEVNLMRFAAERMPFGMPVQGMRKTSNFGARNDPLGRGRAMHKGVDYAGPRDTPIHATADGVVTFSGAQRGYGRIVIVRHAFGFETRYAHLNRSHVKVGERVERGDHIADMGNTGRSTGTHLHYEVRIDREAVDPARFIEAVHDVL